MTLTNPRRPAALSGRGWLAAGGLFVLLACGALVCAGAILMTLLSARQPVSVTLIVSGQGYPVQTGAATVADLLHEYGLVLAEGDHLDPPPTTPLSADLVVRLERARPVTVTVDGQPQTLRTHFSNPLDILRSAGLTPGSRDRITVDGTTASAADLLVWPVPASSISLRRAVPVHIDDDGLLLTLETTAPTIGEALFEAGVTLFLADEVQPALDVPVTTDVTIVVRRSQPISIVADGARLETRSQGATVADALASAGLTLIGLDYTIPAEEALLQPGMVVRLIRVTESVETTQSIIPFETVFQADGGLELDQRQVLQEGQNGIQETITRIRYENGAEVSRETEGEQVTLVPQNRVIAYGTNIVVRTLQTPDGPVEYWRVLRAYATSYHPAALGGDNITSIGRTLTKGIVGVDPRIIPYNTRMYVFDYGIGEAADTGGPRRFKIWVDLGYDDANWVSWSKYVDVYLLTPIPANVLYLLPE